MGIEFVRQVCGGNGCCNLKYLQDVLPEDPTIFVNHVSIGNNQPSLQGHPAKTNISSYQINEYKYPEARRLKGCSALLP